MDGFHLCDKHSFYFTKKRTYSHENWDEFPVSIKRNGRYFFHMVTQYVCRIPRSLVHRVDKDVRIGRVKSEKTKEGCPILRHNEIHESL